MKLRRFLVLAALLPLALAAAPEPAAARTHVSVGVGIGAGPVWGGFHGGYAGYRGYGYRGYRPYRSYWNPGLFISAPLVLGGASYYGSPYYAPAPVYAPAYAPPASAPAYAAPRGNGYGDSAPRPIAEVLEYVPTGQSHAIGAYETTVTRTWETQGGPCRDYVATIQLGGGARETAGTACRDPNGNWRITG
jgi:hypothetical protein